MGRFFSTLLMMGVIGLAIGFVGAPYYGFFALRSAAQSNDAERLSRLVDYNAVRTSLREQVEPNAPPPGPPPSVWQDPIGALRRSLEPMNASPKVDVYLSPQALSALTRGDGRDAERAVLEGPDPRRPFSAPFPGYRFWGPNTARLAVGGEDGETIFTWERQNLFTWKLVHIGLPAREDGTTVRSAPAPAPATK